MNRLRLRSASGVALLVGWLGRRFGASGTSLPGKVLLRLAPDAISGLSTDIPHGSIVVTATNGKTTTCRLASAALSSGSLKPIHNSAGANMSGGIAACLVSAKDRRESNAIGLFEVDEFWIPEVSSQIRPRLLLFGNLFRDNLIATASLIRFSTVGKTASHRSLKRVHDCCFAPTIQLWQASQLG